MVYTVSTASELLQVIGLDSKFDFDVSAPNPPWMDANDDGALSVHSRRERKLERRAERAVNETKHEQCLRIMEDMGFCEVYGQAWVKEMLLRCDNDLEQAIAGLTQYMLIE